MDLIPGRWEIKEAFRNNKLTEALDGIYFDFKSNGTMVSNFNLSVKDTESPYSIVKNILTESGTEKRVYTIESLEPGDLILSTKYQGLSFRLRLVKKTE